MIHFFNRPLTIITPGKCGSSSLHSTLCTIDQGGSYTTGCLDEDWLSKHTNRLPDESKESDWAVAILVRDPYARAGSLYNWHKMHMENQGKPSISFDQYIDQVLLPRRDKFSWPITELYSGWDRHWKIEHIDQVLKQNGFRVPMRKINVSQARTVPSLEQRVKLYGWAVRDCLTFNYPVEYPRHFGMTTLDDQSLIRKAASSLSVRRDGAIVDLGSWMGSTAICLAEGDYKSKVYAIDRYIFEEWMTTSPTAASLKLNVGDSFFEGAKDRMSVHPNIVPIKADIMEAKWDQPIKLLCVDAMKSLDLCKKIVSEYYTKLVPGAIVVHHDFKHFFCPWIHMLHYRLRDSFRHVGEANHGSAVSFRLEGHAPPANAGELSGVTKQEVNEAFAYAASLCKGENMKEIHAAKSKALSIFCGA